MQLSGTVSLLDERLKASLNFFYNDLFNFIYRNNKAAPSEPIYQNAGYLRSAGGELEASWVDSWLHVRLMGTYQRAVSAQSYGTNGGSIFNVPSLSGALSIDVAPVMKWKEFLWLHGAVRFTGETQSPVSLAFKDSAGNPVLFDQPDRVIAAAAIVDLGVRVKNLPVRNVFVQATVYNLFNSFNEVGGSVVHPYPQTGRWFLATIGYTFE